MKVLDIGICGAKIVGRIIFRQLGSFRKSD